MSPQEFAANVVLEYLGIIEKMIMSFPPSNKGKMTKQTLLSNMGFVTHVVKSDAEKLVIVDGAIASWTTHSTSH